MDEFAPILFATVGLSAFILYIVSLWKVFEKAGRPGWEALIPFYNIYRYIKISGSRGWMMFLLVIPIVSLIANIIINLRMAKKFGQSELFGLGISFFGIIFIPILGLGDAEYEHPAGDLVDQIGEDDNVDDDGNHIEEIPLEDW